MAERAHREALIHQGFSELIGGGIVLPREAGVVRRMSRLARNAAVFGQELDAKGTHKMIYPAWAPGTHAVVELRPGIGSQEIVGIRVQDNIDVGNGIMVTKVDDDTANLDGSLPNSDLLGAYDLMVDYSIAPGFPSDADTDAVAGWFQEFYSQFHEPSE